MNDYQIARMYTKKTSAAKDRGLDFTLSIGEFKRLMLRKTCQYTGVTLNNIDGDNFQRTLDRIDNSMGYVKGNVVACCGWYNRLKAVIENPNNELDFNILRKAVESEIKLKGLK